MSKDKNGQVEFVSKKTFSDLLDLFEKEMLKNATLEKQNKELEFDILGVEQKLVDSEEKNVSFSDALANEKRANIVLLNDNKALKQENEELKRENSARRALMMLRPDYSEIDEKIEYFREMQKGWAKQTGKKGHVHILDEVISQSAKRQKISSSESPEKHSSDRMPPPPGAVVRSLGGHVSRYQTRSKGLGGL